MGPGAHVESLLYVMLKVRILIDDLWFIDKVDEKLRNIHNELRL